MAKKDWDGFSLMAVLRNNPILHKKFLDTIGDAFFIVDKERKIVHWNRAAELLTGYSEGEVLGQDCQLGIRCERCLTTCTLFEEGTIEDLKVTLRSKDGNLLFVSKSAFLLYDDDDEVIGGIELLRNETELLDKIQECNYQRQKVEERENLQAAVLGSIREGVLTLDRERKITSFSRRAEEITGWSSPEVIGLHCYDILSSTLCKRACPALDSLHTQEEILNRISNVTVKEEKQLVLAEQSVPLRNEGGDLIGTILILEDRSDWLGWGSEVGENDCFRGIVGRSEAMRQVFRLIDRVAPSDVTVLLTGESGTGKEVAARAIYRHSNRIDGPFQAINCAALPESLLESELFGHVEGAFTGAIRKRVGLIEEAEGGTLFLDEIGEMSLGLQAKLLRFLQEREYQRVGEGRIRKADVRIIAATNRDLAREVSKGSFREDLYYRIRVIPITMPPLRERKEDIALLSNNLLKEIAGKRGRTGLNIAPETLNFFMRYSWPGNVRELINVLEYTVALSKTDCIHMSDLPPELSGTSQRYFPTLGENVEDEATRIQKSLALYQNNRTKAAQALGMHRSTLFRKMKRYGLA